MNVKVCLQYLRELTAGSPHFPDAWKNLGVALSMLGEHEEALSAIDRALAINPHYADAAVCRCFLLGEMGRIGEGLRHFRRVGTTSPDDFNLVFPLGVYCMRFGWKETGLRQLTRAEKMRPNVPFVLAHVSAAMAELGYEEAAAERMERLVKVLKSLKIASLLSLLAKDPPDLSLYQRWENPQAAKLHIVLSHFYALEGELENAENELFLANARFPGHSEFMVEMGKGLLAREQTDEAMDWLSGAVLIDPTCHQGFFEMGFLHANQESLHLAAQALHTAVDLRPLFPDYRFHLGTLLMDLGDVEEAIAEFQRVLELHPGYTMAAVHLANAYIDRGGASQALKVLESSSCGDWPEAMMTCARARVKLGQEDAARNLIKQLLEVDPANLEAREALTEMAGG